MPRTFFTDVREMEFWRGSSTAASGSAIVSANSGFVEFHTLQTSDSAIFQTVALASNGGVRILKPGFVYVEANQDIISSGASNYITFQVRQNSDVRALQLITNTNGQWDGLIIGTSFAVSANDVVTFNISAADVISFDTGNSWGSWSNYSILWYGLAEE